MTTTTNDATAVLFEIQPVVGEAERACALTPATAVLTSILALGAAVGTITLIQMEGRARVRRLCEQDPHSRETHYIELGPVGIHSWCAHVDARYPWADFTRIVENQDFYLFVRPSGNGSAIPKRLVDPSRAEELRRQLREWAPALTASLGPTPS
jgi:hypothetical protein